MAQVSIVQFSEVMENNRFDSEFFKKDYLEAINTIKKIKNIDNLFPAYSNFVKKGIFDISPTRYKHTGIPLVRVSNTNSIFLNKKNMVFIDEETHQQEKKTELSLGDIIFSKVGTIGEISINLEFDKINFGQNNIGIKIRKSKINPYYLVIFLNTKYGKYQILRKQSGQVQQKIVLDDVKSIIIPRIEIETIIEEMLMDSFNKQKRSNLLFQEAEKILLEALSLKNYKPEHELSFDANLHEVLNSKRIDAEYYQPKYKIVEEKINKVKHDKLGKIFDFVKGIEVGGDAYQEEGVPFLRVSNIDVLELDWSNPKFIPEELYEQLNEDYKPKKEEILLSKDGTPGIAYLVRDDIKSIPSSGILRLQLKENKKVNLSYMTLVLNSILIQQQINRDAGGALIKHWRPEEVKNTLVPILDDNTQKKIASKLDESYKLRKESKGLLEKAKTMVEDEIEKEAKK